MPLQAAIAGYSMTDVLKEYGYRSHFMMPYCTRDGRYVQLVGADPAREWPRLCKALGHLEWLEEEKFKDMVGVMKHREDLRERFALGFSKLNLVDAVRVLEEVDATFSVVETIAEVLEDAHLIENEAIVRVESENPDYQWTIANPIEVGGFKKKPPKDAPEIGEHTQDILRESGFSDAEILAMEQSGVVKQYR
jgi:formyl-CoA transferase